MCAQKMSMFPHIVTIYNVFTTTDEETLEDRQVNHITILSGVFCDAKKAENIQGVGLTNADSVNLIIPLDVEAVDGVTGEGQTHLPPLEYEASEEKDRYWTIQPGDSCFFVKGKVIQPDMSFQEINASFDDVHKVTSVNTMDFGSLRHWEVGGA